MDSLYAQGLDTEFGDTFGQGAGFKVSLIKGNGDTSIKFGDDEPNTKKKGKAEPDEYEEPIDNNEELDEKGT